MVNAAGRLIGAMGLSNLPNYLQTRSGMPGKRPRGGGSTKFAKRRKTNRARASKLNRNRSRTKTRTKRKRSKIRRAIAQFPKDLNKEKCFVTLGRQMRPPKATGFLQLVDTWTKVFSSKNGFQAVYGMREFFNKSQIIGFNATNVNSNENWWWVPYSFVVNQFATGSKTYHTGEVANLVNGPTANKSELYNRKDWNIFATTMDLMTTISSLVNVNQNVKILWCTPKVSTDIDPISLWDKALEDEQKNFPIQGDNNTNIKSTETIAGSLRKDIPFQDPRAHKVWNKSWQCVKVHKFSLAPGDHHEIKLNLKLNKMFNMRFLDEWAGKYKPGLTLYPIIIVQGAPVLAVEEGPAVDNVRPIIAEKMVYSKTKVGVNMSAKIHFKELPSNQWNSSKIQTQESYGDIASTVAGGRVVYRLINDIEQVEEVTTAEQPPVEN